MKVQLAGIVAGVCLLGLGLWGVALPPPEARRLPFAAQARLVVARNAPTQAPSALSLVCTSQGDLRLVLVSRLAVPTEFKRLGRHEASVSVGRGANYRHFLTPADLVDIGRYDTIVSRPLSPAQTEDMAQGVGAKPPQRVGVLYRDCGVFLRSVVTEQDIRALASFCRPPAPG